MATLEQYGAVAPTVMSVGSFTKSQIENKLSSIPTKPDEQPEPEITKTKVVAIFNAIFAESTVEKSVQAAGGLRKIASDNNLTPAQVRKIAKELVAMQNLYNSGQ